MVNLGNSIEPLPEPEKDDETSWGEWIIAGVFILIIVNAWVGLDWLYEMFR